MAGQGMRMALKGSTPSAHARLKYITREGKYAQGIDGKRDDLAASGSGNLPNWADDADQFWHGVDQFERANARRCVELELNLPPELTLDQQRQVVEAYAERLLGAERLPHTWAIHEGGGKNPHCHLMFQERGLDGIDRPNAKAWFKRANTAHPERGGAIKSRSIHGQKWTLHARATWAETANDGLRAAGHDPRFDHRSKVVQRDDALRNGDLRRAAELGTLTERHEGAKINGMRRRVERGEIEFEKLPEYAQQRIQQNERVRAYNNELRDWARSATDAELAERLAPELVELAEQLAQESPGAHVAVWKDHQQQLAVELEQAHGAALVEWVERARAELAEQLAQENPGAHVAVWKDHQQQQLAVELEQAHGAALVEWVERARVELAEQLAQENPGAHVAVWEDHQQQLAVELEQAHGAALVEWVERSRARVIELRPAAVRPPAPDMDRLDTLKATAKSATAEAAAAEKAKKDWRTEHPRRAAVADFMGQPLAVDLAAERARQRKTTAVEAYRDAPERAAAVAWQRAERELTALEPQLPAMERAAGLKPMHELEQEQHELKTQTRKLLREASKDLRTANGRIENELTRCGHDERPLLFAMRREIDLEMRQLQELHQGIPDPAEALQLRESAAQRLVEVEGWRESQDAAKEDQRLRDRQQRPDADPAPEHDPSPSRQGPRLG